MHIHIMYIIKGDFFSERYTHPAPTQGYFWGKAAHSARSAHGQRSSRQGRPVIAT